MATNNEGMGGVVIEHIALEKTTLIGMQAPNSFPSTREADDRLLLPELTISPNKGCEIRDTPAYDCEPIDTSWLSYGGKYTLGVGNKWHIRVGSGGIHTETIGPVMNDYEIVINNAKKGFFVQTNLFQVNIGKRGMMAGTRMDFNFDETNFHGNTRFLNNAIVNGGLYVNGELICNHITTQKQMGMTSFNEDNKAYINPAQSFHIFNGASSAAQKYVNEGLLNGLWRAIDWSDAEEKLQGGMVDIEFFVNLDPILQLLPGLGEIIGGAVRQIHIPCKIAFPKGISLISDAVDYNDPTAYSTINSGVRVPGMTMKKEDVFGPGHTHQYAGPACNYTSDTTSTYAQGQQVLQDEPLKHKKTVFGGADSIEKAKEEITNMGQNYIKDYGKRILNFINPFSD